MVICFILGGIIQQDWFCSGSHNFVPWELLPAIWHPTILFYCWTPGSLGHLMIGLLSPRIYYFSGTSWLLSLESGMDAAVCTCSCPMSVLFPITEAWTLGHWLFILSRISNSLWPFCLDPRDLYLLPRHCSHRSSGYESALPFLQCFLTSLRRAGWCEFALHW